MFILVLLPFTFIQFVFVPWMESSQRARAPRRIGKDVRGMMLMTGMGAVQAALVVRLRRAGIPYAVMVSEVDEALQLHDDGYDVLVGDLDDPEALAGAGVDRARLVVALAADIANTNVAFTVREISHEVSVVATSGAPDAVDILQLAGCDEVLELGELLGTALARRVLFPDGRAHVIGELGDLLVAEAEPPEASVGVRLTEWPIRRRTGLTVAGVWQRGTLRVARPTTVLSASDTLVLAGSGDQLPATTRCTAPSGACRGP